MTAIAVIQETVAWPWR